MKPAIEVLDIRRDELNALLEHARAALGEEAYVRLKAVVEGLSYRTELIADKDPTIRDLPQLLFPLVSEKTREILKRAGLEEEQKPAAGRDESTAGGNKQKKPGHGRKGAEAYVGASRVEVAHASLESGDRCPACEKGRVYEQQNPKVLVRIVGQAPLAGTVYELQRLRCNPCGEIYTAQAPEGVGEEKYDDTAAAIIAQMKYGGGMAFHRLEHLQENMGIPLPAATQWEIVEEAAELLGPAYEELIRQAAQGEGLHNDDTSMRVLRLAREPSDERTGVFTSGIVSTKQGQRIALYFTGRQHAGENLRDVLQHRVAELGAPIQMCDALSRNTPKLSDGTEILLANCLAHGRRQFVEVATNFPEPCRYVLEMLGDVYRNDAEARTGKLRPAERLEFHQQHSGPVMQQLHQWLEAQFALKRVEPNSGLVKAVTYLLRHWKGLTAFLREAGAPLDNNVCERALKRAVLHRKNALFYRTLHGAEAGDLFRSLIHTCELSNANPFDYLTELQKYPAELVANPSAWMPWNYTETLTRVGVR